MNKLRTYFRKLSIRHKLTIIIVGITFFALTIAMLVGSFTNYVVMKSDIKEQVEIISDFTALNISSALDFLDNQAAEESLHALAFNPSIREVCVFDSDQQFFTAHHINNDLHNCPKHFQDIERKKDFNTLFHQQPIIVNGVNLGSLTILYDLTSMHRVFAGVTLIKSIIFCMALAIAYVLANISQKIISRPVIELAEAAHKFAGHEDFSIKVKKTTDDELGNMVTAFNQMAEKMKQRDEIIVKAREEAISANHMKSEFLANMSHELRTPLNSIIGISQILNEDMPDGEERDMAGTVNKSAVTLLEIVNDILDLSKIEANQMQFESIGFNFENIVDTLMETLSPIASKKGIWLRSRYKNDNLPLIKGDPLRLSRILTNLISNGLKYTLEGGVEFVIDWKAISDKEIELECTVIDTGIGIPGEMHGKIFQKFTQTDESITRKFGGTGLGLAITRELVEKMGGEIGVSSEEGKGSTFWFKLQFPITDSVHDDENNVEQSIQETSGEEGDKLKASEARVLVAEDHELNQILIKKLLKRTGFLSFKIANDGREALSIYKKNEFDLILMDCHMPEMNGYQVTQKIRAIEKNSEKHIPIIALTADAMVGTREKCLEAGMDDYVSKPINIEALNKSMDRWITLDGVSSNTKGNDDTDSTDDILDSSAIWEYADNEEEMHDFFEIFRSQTLVSLDALEQQITDGENEEWSEIAHKIKGGAGMIGAKALSKLAAKAQDMRTASRDDRNAAFTEMQAAYETVIGIFKEQALKAK